MTPTMMTTTTGQVGTEHNLYLLDVNRSISDFEGPNRGDQSLVSPEGQ